MRKAIVNAQDVTTNECRSQLSKEAANSPNSKAPPQEWSVQRPQDDVEVVEAYATAYTYDEGEMALRTMVSKPANGSVEHYKRTGGYGKGGHWGGCKVKYIESDITVDGSSHRYLKNTDIGLCQSGVKMLCSSVKKNPSHDEHENTS